MGKLFFWIAVGIGAWVAWRVFVLRKRGAARGRAADRATAGNAEDMASCARCGVYFPVAEAVSDGAGRVYCSHEHRDAVGPAR